MTTADDAAHTSSTSAHLVDDHALQERLQEPLPPVGIDLLHHGARRGALLAAAPIFFAVAVLVVATCGLRSASVWRAVIPLGFAVAALVSLAGVLVAARAVGELRRTPEDERPRGMLLAALTIPLGALAFVMSAMTSLSSLVAFSRGRQLRRRGKPQVSELVDSRDWIVALPAVQGPALAADAWRDNGKTEHASVAAFALHAAELIAVGAPPVLIEAAHKDALDESEHTRLCMSLAHAIDGRARGPAPFAVARESEMGLPRSLALARLASSSLLEGALYEAVSAAVVARLIPRAGDVTIARVLKQIASDEGRHAAHAWDVIAWCVAQSPGTVVPALRGALAGLPHALGPSVTPRADDGALEPWGIPGRALEEECFAKVRTQVVTRCVTLLAVRPPLERVPPQVA
jgi:hypothetical protein